MKNNIEIVPLNTEDEIARSKAEYVMSEALYSCNESVALILKRERDRWFTATFECYGTALQFGLDLYLKSGGDCMVKNIDEFEGDCDIHGEFGLRNIFVAAIDPAKSAHWDGMPAFNPKGYAVAWRQ